MRIVYLDEAGISAREPVAVVAGVIVDGDRQLVPAAARIQDLVNEYVPLEKRVGFAFHAKELVNGGATFSRDDSRRLEILWKLVRLPYELQLPIVIGFAWKQYAPVPDNLPSEKKATWIHLAGFSQWVVGAERYMRESASAGEIALCVAEDTPSARRSIKTMFANLCDHRIVGLHLPANMHDHLPIGRLIDTVYFATKHEARILCLADLCAYVTKRYFTKAKYGAELFAQLTTGAEPPDISRKMGYYVFAPQ